MRTYNSLVFKISLLLCLSQLITACGSDSADETKLKKAATQTASVASAQPSTNIPHQWKMSQQTDNKTFSAVFSCQKKPRIGEFRSCHLQLTRGGEKVSGAKISIDGGMRSHGHGLPTKPQVTATKVSGLYKIEGLKFTMPGEWDVGFKMLSKDVTDQVVFTFTI